MLSETLREAATRFSDFPAYVTPSGWTLTYRDLLASTLETAAGLAARGVHAGDVVALALPPGPEYLVGYLAAAHIGAITAGVNTRLSAPERNAVLDRAQPALVLAAPGFEPAGHDQLTVARAERVETFLHGLRVADREPPAVENDPDRPVAIVFTSGTTGVPKGAVYCNRQLSYITEVDTGGAWGGAPRTFSGTSFAHLGFMTKLPGALRRGGTTWIMERWSARESLSMTAELGLTTVAGVPTQFALMLRDPEFDTFDLSSVRMLIAGGGPITPGLADEARRRFGAALTTRYSCTEAGIGLGTASTDPLEDAVETVGRPLAGVELVLLDDDDRAVPSGEVGAVCLRSPAVMTEYWRDPEQTQAAFTSDGFVRTGDLGWLDDHGRLHLVGRAKEMYVRGGYNVFPVEVEAALSEHPAVRAVAVIARADDVMGEVGVACVVPTDPAHPPSIEDLRSFVTSRLAKYKLPDALVLLDDLPLTAGDKIDRAALRVRLTP
ncbi:MAG: class I adenylate-forming enzyme family protein [Acidimicrobiia bacterium]